MKRMIMHRINHLRQQPEHVRLRAIMLMSAVSGVSIFLLWVFILLPLQVRTIKGQPPASQATAPTQTPSSTNGTGSVAGTATNTPPPVATQQFQALSTSQPAVPPSLTPSPSPSSIPVRITE